MAAGTEEFLYLFVLHFGQINIIVTEVIKIRSSSVLHVFDYMYRNRWSNFSLIL